MTTQLEELEKTYLDSVYVISHSPQTLRSYKTAINRLRSFLKEKHNINELDLLEKTQSNELDIYSLRKKILLLKELVTITI